MSKPLCVIQAPVFSRSGYGDWSKEVVKSVIRYDKFDVRIAATKWGGNVIKRTDEELDPSDPMNKVLFEKTLREPLNRQPDVFIQISIPNEFNPIGKYNIGMTAGIETTAAAGEWIEGLNRMNMNIVTSKHSKKVFDEADYTREYKDGSGRKEPLRSEKPMEVCFWGANTNVYKRTDEKVESIEKIMSTIPETFAFLFVGQWTSAGAFHDRKDIGNLIKTFLETFKDRAQKPCLILKTSGTNFSKVDLNETLKRIKVVETMVQGDLPKVYLVHGELNDVEMNALYNHEKVKCHVSFTHGEGFGHPLLLASLSGKPVLAPNWSGQLDFLSSVPDNLFQGKLEQLNPASVNQWLIKESAWFVVANGLAQDKLKRVFFGMSQKSKDKSIELAENNSKDFSLESMDKVLHGILDTYVPEFAVEQKIVIPRLILPTSNSPSLEFLEEIITYNLNQPKIRFGRQQDGGYVLSNYKLDEIESVYSFGVDCEMEMEKQFNKINPKAKIHLYDPAEKIGYSRFDQTKHTEFLKNLPREYCTFESIGVCAEKNSSDVLKSLNYLIDKNGDSNKKLLLKMDIEGGEFEVLNDVKNEVLNKFQQMTIEFHFDLSGNDSTFSLYRNVFKKLNSIFNIFHIHANNYGMVKNINGYDIPSVMEISFANKSLFTNSVLSKTANEGTEYLDFPNNVNAPEIQLVSWPFVRNV